MLECDAEVRARCLLCEQPFPLVNKSGNASPLHFTPPELELVTW